MMKKIVTALTVLAVMFAVSCGKDKKESATTAIAIPVKVSKATAGNNTRYITASGKTEAENSAVVSTRIMGYITKVYVKTGQKVRAGQLLVSINNTDLQAKKAQADAAVLQAAATLIMPGKIMTGSERFSASKAFRRKSWTIWPRVTKWQKQR